MIAMRDCQYRNFSVTISGKGPPYAVSASYRGLSAAASFSQDALDPVWQEHLALLSASHGNQGEERLVKSVAGSFPNCCGRMCGTSGIRPAVI